MFTVEARIHGLNGRARPEFVGRAAGSTKKKAEQEAARIALEAMERSAAPEPLLAAPALEPEPLPPPRRTIKRKRASRK